MLLQEKNAWDEAVVEEAAIGTAGLASWQLKHDAPKFTESHILGPRSWLEFYSPNTRAFPPTLKFSPYVTII